MNGDSFPSGCTKQAVFDPQRQSDICLTGLRFELASFIMPKVKSVIMKDKTENHVPFSEVWMGLPTERLEWVPALTWLKVTCVDSIAKTRKCGSASFKTCRMQGQAMNLHNKKVRKTTRPQSLIGRERP